MAWYVGRDDRETEENYKEAVKSANMLIGLTLLFVVTVFAVLMLVGKLQNYRADRHPSEPHKLVHVGSTPTSVT